MEDKRLNEEIRSLKEDLAVLRADVAGLSETLKSAAGERVDDIQSAVNEEVQEARRRLKEKIAEARGRSARAMEDMEETIGERPLASVAAAVGVGFILAKIMDLGSRR